MSCFGISSRESLLKEIENICRVEDKTLYKSIVNILHKIPGIGGILYVLLKKEYQLSNIKKGSIFIFDDFERITPISAIAVEKENGIDPFYDRIDSKVLTRRENKIITEAIKKISNLTVEIDKREISQVEVLMLDKFNIVTGLINEIQERFEMKVIIVADKDKIPFQIFDNILESKLACRKYWMRRTDMDKVWENLVEKQLRSFRSVAELNKKCIEETLKEESKLILGIWEKTRLENIRILDGVIASFINSCERYPELYNNKRLREDLLCCKFIAKISINLGFEDTLLRIKTGENIKFLIEKANMYCDSWNMKYKKVDIFENEEKGNVLRWCGAELSFECIVGKYGLVDIGKIKYELSKIKNDFAEKYYSNPKEAIPESFEDTMFYLLKNNDKESVEKITALLDEDRIDMIFENRFIDIFQNKRKADSIFRYMDLFGINEICLIDKKFKNTIFNKIKNEFDKMNITEEELGSINSKIVNQYRLWLSGEKKIEDEPLKVEEKVSSIDVNEKTNKNPK